MKGLRVLKLSLGLALLALTLNVSAQNESEEERPEGTAAGSVECMRADGSCRNHVHTGLLTQNVQEIKKIVDRLIAEPKGAPSSLGGERSTSD